MRKAIVSDEIDGPTPPRRRWRLHHGLDNWLVIGLFLLVLMISISFALVLPLVHSLRASMADTQTTPQPAPINGERAMGYLKQICAIGPRPAGSEANAKQRKLVAEHFKAMGATVREQKFSGHDPQTRAKVDM